MNWIVRAYADLFSVTLGYLDTNNTAHHTEATLRNGGRTRDEAKSRRVR